MTKINDHLVMVGGTSASGKSASLMGLENQSGVLYLNCESGKRLPFKSQFMELTITDPYQIYEAFDGAETMDNIHTIVVDSQTYLMDLFESVYIVNAANGQKAWGDFAHFFKKVMLEYVARSTKNVIFTAHTLDTYNEKDMVMETKIPVKGALKNNGIESYFSVIIAAKKLPLSALKDYENDLLTITPEEEALGFKYVYQTKLTKETVNERLRGPLGLFSTAETFIDNNIQLVMNRLHQYYGTQEVAA